MAICKVDDQSHPKDPPQNIFIGRKSVPDFNPADSKCSMFLFGVYRETGRDRDRHKDENTHPNEILKERSFARDTHSKYTQSVNLMYHLTHYFRT